MDPTAKAPKKDGKKGKDDNLQKLEDELAKMKELAARAQADLQNAKDRMDKEAVDIRKFALQGLLMKLLPTLDNMYRAFGHLPEDLSDHEWVKGLQAVEQDLVRELGSVGLEHMNCVGETADPHKHEVMQTGPGEKDVIVEVFEEGYELQGRVLRPAKVKVGDGKIEN
jgi:molecular chaperone GrpE